MNRRIFLSALISALGVDAWLLPRRLARGGTIAPCRALVGERAGETVISPAALEKFREAWADAEASRETFSCR